MIETFPEVEVVIFPYTAKTREKGPATPDNVEQVDPGYKSDLGGSIFDSLRARDVGLVTIKPFFGGSLFKIEQKFPVIGVGSKDENDLARLTLQAILTNATVTATVPGLTTIYEVENAARASYTRPLAMAPAEREWLLRTTDEQWAALPTEYAWLRDWEVV